MSRVFSNTMSPMTSVCMLNVGEMAASSYLSRYADKLLKGENQSTTTYDYGCNTENYGTIRIATNDAGLYPLLIRRPVRGIMPRLDSLLDQ